ncbi:Pycsar system effector family protein [Kitasatospora sp. NPDC094019]|uniref:Pycsar system effector family protein n=1 Tax=Kitasatospora sp. NPDC094019 TaxID=3364091 RepID=UPI0037F13872
MSNEEAVRTAWQIHASLTEVTGRVDAKASFALTIESAALGAIVALSGAGVRLGRLSGPLPASLFWLGAALLGCAALAAVSVVIPRGDASARTGPSNFVYYGQLRHWSPDRLATRLEESDLLPVLTWQLVEMSRIVWVKHQRVRQSLVLAVLGCAMVALAGLLG